MASCTLTESRRDNTVVLSLSGRLDNNASGVIESGIAPHLANREKRIVLDLSSVDYLSSAGARSVLMAVKKSTMSGTNLVLCGVVPNVLEVLKLSGLLSILKIYPDATAATAA